jgi:hypothetical protein
VSAEEWTKHRAVVVDGDDAVDVTPEVTRALCDDRGKAKK